MSDVKDGKTTLPELTSRQARIMIIEDDFLLLDSMMEILTEYYATVGLTEARKALDLIEQKHFDLVLTDIQLACPSILCTNIVAAVRDRSANPEVSIIAMSGAARDDEIVRTSMAKGAAAFLPKPFETELMIQTITRFLA